MRLAFLSMLGEPGSFDPSVYDDAPGGLDECEWVRRTFSYLQGWDYQGYDLCKGEEPPAPEEADAFILGGSYNSVHDDYPWQRKILKWFDRLSGAKKPLLAICGGHQLLARYYGAEVVYLEGEEMAGTQPVQAVGKGDRHPLFAGLNQPMQFHFANEEHVSTKPDNATLLASHPRIPYAAFDFGNGWYSTQFHPEAETAILAGSWAPLRPDFAAAYREDHDGTGLIDNFLAIAQS